MLCVEGRVRQREPHVGKGRVEQGHSLSHCGAGRGALAAVLGGAGGGGVQLMRSLEATWTGP